MANESAALDTVFFALSDPTRRGILARLGQGEATVGELAAPFAMALPSISKHLKVLERAGLLRRRVEGRVHRIALAPEGLRTAAEWLAFYEPFWEEGVDRLARLVGELAQAEATTREETTG